MSDADAALPDVGRHYRRLADHYDANWEHSETFMAWMTGQVMAVLEREPGSTVADIGGGTGLYSTRLLAAGGYGTVVCVDPSAEMLAAVPKLSGVRTVLADASLAPAELEARGLAPLDHILIKEAVHHFGDIEGDLSGLASMLSAGGSMAVVMLPPTIDYPLFRAAIDRFEERQPHYDRVAESLRRAGLTVTVSEAGFELEIPVERYHRMVESRYLSLLSEFSDAELSAGIEEMSGRRPVDGIYRFVDRFVFVKGVRGS